MTMSLKKSLQAKASKLRRQSKDESRDDAGSADEVITGLTGPSSSNLSVPSTSSNLSVPSTKQKGALLEEHILSSRTQSSLSEKSARSINSMKSATIPDSVHHEEIKCNGSNLGKISESENAHKSSHSDEMSSPSRSSATLIQKNSSRSSETLIQKSSLPPVSLSRIKSIQSQASATQTSKSSKRLSISDASLSNNNLSRSSETLIKKKPIPPVFLSRTKSNQSQVSKQTKTVSSKGPGTPVSPPLAAVASSLQAKENPAVAAIEQKPSISLSEFASASTHTMTGIVIQIDDDLHGSLMTAKSSIYNLSSSYTSSDESVTTQNMIVALKSSRLQEEAEDTENAPNKVILIPMNDVNSTQIPFAAKSQIVDDAIPHEYSRRLNRQKSDQLLDEINAFADVASQLLAGADVRNGSSDEADLLHKISLFMEGSANGAGGMIGSVRAILPTIQEKINGRPKTSSKSLRVVPVDDGTDFFNKLNDAIDNGLDYLQQMHPTSGVFTGFGTIKRGLDCSSVLHLSLVKLKDRAPITCFNSEEPVEAIMVKKFEEDGESVLIQLNEDEFEITTKMADLVRKDTEAQETILSKKSSVGSRKSKRTSNVRSSYSMPLDQEGTLNEEAYEVTTEMADTVRKDTEAHETILSKKSLVSSKKSKALGTSNVRSSYAMPLDEEDTITFRIVAKTDSLTSKRTLKLTRSDNRSSIVKAPLAASQTQKPVEKVVSLPEPGIQSSDTPSINTTGSPASNQTQTQSSTSVVSKSSSKILQSSSPSKDQSHAFDKSQQENVKSSCNSEFPSSFTKSMSVSKKASTSIGSKFSSPISKHNSAGSSLTYSQDRSVLERNMDDCEKGGSNIFKKLSSSLSRSSNGSTILGKKESKPGANVVPSVPSKVYKQSE